MPSLGSYGFSLCLVEHGVPSPVRLCLAYLSLILEPLNPTWLCPTDTRRGMLGTPPSLVALPNLPTHLILQTGLIQERIGGNLAAESLQLIDTFLQLLDKVLVAGFGIRQSTLNLRLLFLQYLAFLDKGLFQAFGDLLLPPLEARLVVLEGDAGLDGDIVSVHHSALSGACVLGDGGSVRGSEALPDADETGQGDAGKGPEQEPSIRAQRLRGCLKTNLLILNR